MAVTNAKGKVQMKTECVVSGKKIQLTANDVEIRLKDIIPEPARFLAVRVNWQFDAECLGTYRQTLSRPDGSLPVKGDSAWIHPSDRPYADQKATFISNHVIDRPHSILKE